MTAEEFKSRLLPVKNKLFRLAFSLLANRQEAEDAVQEVYLKIWNMRDNLGKYKSIEALMMTVTRNHCLDRLKTKKNKAVSLHQEFKVLNHVDEPGEHAEKAELIDFVKQIIDLLPEQQKTFVHLRDVEGYTYDEIAEITGQNLNYIRVNISRGRKKIKESIEKIMRYDTSRTSRFN